MSLLSHRSRYASNPIEEEDKVAEKLAERGRKIIKLNRGDPTAYFRTPKYMIDAYVAALKAGRTGYSDHAGVKRLREAVADRYQRMYGLRTDADHVLITQGLSEAIMLINAALINPGDKAVLFKPGYPLYAPYLKLYGGHEIAGCYEERYGWNIDTDHLKRILGKQLKGKKPKYMMITNPNNPTGTVLDRSVLEEVVDLANEHNIVLISDEIYDEIFFNGAKFTSMCKLARGMPHIILNGASKDYDATGFRIGFVLMPEDDPTSNEIRDKLRGFAMMRLCPNTPAQYAVAEALDNFKEHGRAVRSMVRQISDRANFATRLINNSDYMKAVKPKGAYYILPRVHLNKLRISNDKEFVDRLLREEFVQLTRGSGFEARDHVRIVTLPTKDILESAIIKINEFCKRHKK